MHVEVTVYGNLKRKVGDHPLRLELDLQQASVADLGRRLEAAYPALDGALATVAYAVGGQVVGRDYALADGDSVALLPPVSGG